MNKVILDASAVLALLNQEPGHETVESYLPNTIISAVNFSEVISIMPEIGLDNEQVEDLIKGIVGTIIPFDQEQAILTAKLRKTTKSEGLSLADRACLALAKSQKLPILTADKAWKRLKLNLEINFIR